MNKETQLLVLLDRVFGFTDKVKSTFRKISQGFDQHTNEHVFIIEYRVRTKNTVPGMPMKPTPPIDQEQAHNLLAQVNRLAKEAK
jgi:hypothetical protein